MVAKIVIGKSSCQIIDEYDTDFLKHLDSELSFWIQGAEFSKAYKGYINEHTGAEVTWDGCRKLLTGNLRFPSGLLRRVSITFEGAGKPYQIVDARPALIPGHSIDIISKLNSLGKIPYPYQLETVTKVKDQSCGVIRIPTGAGKTIIAALLTAALGKTTIIYVIGKDLLYQIHGLFQSLFDQKIGIVGDGKCDISDINIATIWTVGQAIGLKKAPKAEDEGDEKKLEPEKYKLIRNMLARAKVHIWDECHLAACDTIQAIGKKISPENIYGLSASPVRDDGADLLIEALLGPQIIDIPARNLIAEGYLVPPLIKFLTVPKLELKIRPKYKTVYKDYIATNIRRNNMVATGAERLVEQGYQTLVLFHDLKHGKILHELISEKLPCEILSGQDNIERRNSVKAKLEDGKLKCVLASKIFDIGVDLPSLSGLIIAGGGESSVRALQRIGRVIRRYPGKTNSAVIDFADQAPFLFDHAKKRRDVYQREFDVIWPNEK